MITNTPLQSNNGGAPRVSLKQVLNETRHTVVQDMFIQCDADSPVLIMVDSNPGGTRLTNQGGVAPTPAQLAASSFAIPYLVTGIKAVATQGRERRGSSKAALEESINNLLNHPTAHVEIWAVPAEYNPQQLAGMAPYSPQWVNKLSEIATPKEGAEEVLVYSNTALFSRLSRANAQGGIKQTGEFAYTFIRPSVNKKDRLFFEIEKQANRTTGETYNALKSNETSGVNQFNFRAIQVLNDYFGRSLLGFEIPENLDPELEAELRIQLAAMAKIRDYIQEAKEDNNAINQQIGSFKNSVVAGGNGQPTAPAPAVAAPNLAV